MLLTLTFESADTTIHPAIPVASASKAGEEIILVHEGEYREGDAFVLSGGTEGVHAFVQLDDALPPALVYLSGGSYRFSIPFGEKKKCFNPRAFTGNRHLLYARIATPAETGAFRNLALNPYDAHGNAVLFPHAGANAETRGEPVFAARNAIDGLKASAGHGEWPFTSWGINRDPNASLRIEFGRSVIVSRAVFYLRADFPHDSWWSSATLKFSDGTALPVSFRKAAGAQPVDFSERTVEWVVLDGLIKNDDPSPFPALTQFEMYGTEANR